MHYAGEPLYLHINNESGTKFIIPHFFWDFFLPLNHTVENYDTVWKWVLADFSLSQPIFPLAHSIPATRMEKLAPQKMKIQLCSKLFDFVTHVFWYTGHRDQKKKNILPLTLLRQWAGIINHKFTKNNCFFFF